MEIGDRWKILRIFIVERNKDRIFAKYFPKWAIDFRVGNTWRRVLDKAKERKRSSK